jgi:hypothetical protein
MGPPRASLGINSPSHHTVLDAFFAASAAQSMKVPPSMNRPLPQPKRLRQGFIRGHLVFKCPATIKDETGATIRMRLRRGRPVGAKAQPERRPASPGGAFFLRVIAPGRWRATGPYTMECSFNDTASSQTQQKNKNPGSEPGFSILHRGAGLTELAGLTESALAAAAGSSPTRWCRCP